MEFFLCTLTPDVQCRLVHRNHVIWRTKITKFWQNGNSSRFVIYFWQGPSCHKIMDHSWSLWMDAVKQKLLPSWYYMATVRYLRPSAAAVVYSPHSFRSCRQIRKVYLPCMNIPFLHLFLMFSQHTHNCPCFRQAQNFKCYCLSVGAIFKWQCYEFK